uniref:Uncharacterized protein n=1 Tax=uncultured bacterium pAP3 TaxID=1781154 RepID=A0A1C9U4M8_9BACT|nr:hypothetical protein [uncultured bacterium pAP3]
MCHRHPPAPWSWACSSHALRPTGSLRYSNSSTPPRPARNAAPSPMCARCSPSTCRTASSRCRRRGIPGNRAIESKTRLSPCSARSSKRRRSTTPKRWRGVPGVSAPTTDDSWLRPPMGFDASQGACHVGVAVNHVAAIGHHGGHLDDAQAPGIGDTLVGAADASLQGLAAIAQALLHERGRAAGVVWQTGRQLGLDALGQVQLDHAGAASGLQRMPAVGHDQHVGGRCGLAEQTQQQASRARDARDPQSRNGTEQGSRHGGRPGDESKASSRTPKACPLRQGMRTAYPPLSQPVQGRRTGAEAPVGIRQPQPLQPEWLGGHGPAKTDRPAGRRVRGHAGAGLRPCCSCPSRLRRKLRHSGHRPDWQRRPLPRST